MHPWSPFTSEKLRRSVEATGICQRTFSIFGSEKDKFARWGDNYAYHIGDLSAAVLINHPVEKRNPKYSAWAATLFRSTPTDKPKLAFDIYFWAKAWKSTDVGVWPELSSTRLAFLEYLLIGVASTAFDGSLLNYEGKNRFSVQADIPDPLTLT